MTQDKAPATGWIVAAASFGFVVVQLDVTIVNVALPAMARSLGGGVAGLQWVVDAYTLAFAVLLLSAGVLGDLFGGRRMYLAGFGLFALASAACGLAPTPTLLIAARAVQGAGAALMVPNSLAVLNHATSHDPKVRARSVGLWTAAGGLSIGAGPVIGGLLIATVGWRWIFLVNIPLCVLGAGLTWLGAPVTPSRQGRGRLDPPGQGLAILSLVGLIGAVIEIRPLGPASPWVIGAALAGLVAAVLFVAAERRSPAPMLPLAFFKDAGFNAAIAFGIAVNLAYYGVLFVLTLYLQNAHHWSPLRSGLALLPLTLTFLGSNVVSGWMIGKFGSRLPMVVGGAVGAAGYVLLLVAQPKTPFLVLLPIFLLIPSGMGLGVPAMTTAILAGVDKAYSATASAVLNAARQAAAAVGVALFGALAGETRVVSGLHASSIVSAVLLALAALIAARWIRPAKTR